MQRFALSVCSRCRPSFSKQSTTLFNEGQYIARRFRSGTPSRNKKQPKTGFSVPTARGEYAPNSRPRRPPNFHKKRIAPVKEQLIPIEEVPRALQIRVGDWSKMPGMRRRLQAFGIPVADIPILLNAFVKAVASGVLSSPGIREQYTLDRFTDIGSDAGRTDDILTNIFYAWASDPSHQPFLETIVPPTTLHSIIQLRAAADLSYPADHFPRARSTHRTFHLHVGPTNSGKTHNALRALAAADSGVYAGPLRLLAHEVWERLNKGQIVPLGMDPEGQVAPDPDSGMDAVVDENPKPPTVQGNARYVRECNLLTGEEHKLVSDHARLLSCTIEMLSYEKVFDVAVVDEIQMIADPERGGAWSSAVLGLNAKHIHLCGEETAIPVIEALLKETGDEFIVNRYERLTPLVVQEESLDGKLSRIQKGDCLVTFSRSGIFALKRQVEEQTGLRCAVAYGRLPPEIRSEQAALFNNPDSDYDVMIGSDAIGMGLNLKIKRIVFESVSKFNGIQDVQLSTSQIKQIAGRAGRYGLHREAGGFVTTLRPEDLPILRKALNTDMKPLTRAFISHQTEISGNIVGSLPLDSSMLTLYEVYACVSRLRWPFHVQRVNHVQNMCEFIDTKLGDVTLHDRIMLMMAPIPWRDPKVVDIVGTFCRQYRNNMQVSLIEGLSAGPLSHLEDVEMCMKHGPPRSSHQTLNTLEVLHKLLIFYMWMQMRSPVVWCNHAEVQDLKERTERALDWCLQGISWGKPTQRLPDLVLLREKNEDERVSFFGLKDVRERRQARRKDYRSAELHQRL